MTQNLTLKVEVPCDLNNINELRSKHSIYKSHFGTIRIETLNNQIEDFESILKVNTLQHLDDPMSIPLKKAKISIAGTNQDSTTKTLDILYKKGSDNSRDFITTSVKYSNNVSAKIDNKNERKNDIPDIKINKKEKIKISDQTPIDKVPKPKPTNNLINKMVKNKENLSNDVMAIDIVKEMRREKRNLVLSDSNSKVRTVEPFVGIKELGLGKDSKGFNTYSSQIQNWYTVPRYQVIDELKKNIIYEDDDLLAINKPYGISVMGDKASLYSIYSLNQDLAKVLRLKTDRLHIVHRLDKDCTGVLLLAKNLETQARVNEMFRLRQVRKVYWAITAGVPDNPEGTIDIPLKEQEFNGIHKVFVAPVFDEKGHVLKGNARDLSRSLKTDSNSSSVTTYETLRRTGSAALLRLEAKTGFKHQVRVHLAYGLSCPILGDHKYSHLNEMKPQRLPQEMLEKLNIRQTKVRTIPLHLHAHSLILPLIRGGDNSSKSRTSNTLEISAPKLHYHFKTNLKSLGLTIYKN